MATETHTEPRELAYRAADGLEITLLWHPADDRLAVTVCDAKLGERFEVPAPRDRALEVFYHPFAYAAHSGIEYGSPAVELGDTAGV